MRRLWVFAILIALLLGLGASSAFASDLVVQSVDTSGYPAVKMVVALPYEMVEGNRKPVFSLVENGVQREVKAIAPAGSTGRDPIDVVLVLDASGSMKGNPLQEAKRAAQEFVSAMAPGDRVAVITFGTQPKLITPFTSDRAELAQAITSVEIRGETALYDAVSSGVDLAKDSKSDQRYLVVLSDGGDTASSTTMDATAKKLAAAGVPIYAVALSSKDYNPDALRTLAKSSRGTMVTAEDEGLLTTIFKRVAQGIQDVWTVSYRSAAPQTPDLEIVLTAHRGDQKARAVTLVDNPDFLTPTAQAPPRVRFGGLFSVIGWNIALLIGVAVGLLVFGVGLLLLREGPAVDQLAYYNQVRAQRESFEEGDADPEGVRARLRRSIDQAAGRSGVSADLKGRIERAGLKVRPSEFIYFHIIGVVCAAAATQIVFSRVLISALVAVLATATPFVAMSSMANSRRKKFEAQLPDILALISGSLRAGWGIQQAIDLIVEETPEPARGEFRRVQSETRLGLSLEESLEKMALRLDSEDFHWVVAAIGIQREVGGNLAEVLDIAAGTIRERAELRREVSALTAEGRFSAIVLVALPFIMLIALNVIAPRYLSNMTRNIEGWYMLGGAMVLLIVGGIWLIQISKVEV